MKAIRYREAYGIITTKEWAKGMKGVLYVVTEADGSEGLRTVDQLKKLEVVEEPKHAVKPKPAAKPKRTPRRKVEATNPAISQTMPPPMPTINAERSAPDDIRCP